MTDLSRAIAEEAKTAAAQRYAQFWAAAAAYFDAQRAKAQTPDGVRLREIREQIKTVTDRQREAEAPYIADEREIEAQIAALKVRLAATYEERCRVAAPFETELDALYAEELEVDGR